jgi:TolB protein
MALRSTHTKPDMRRRLFALSVVFGIASAIPGFASSTENWQRYTDKVLQVTFRYPKEWKTSPVYSDRTYFEGPDGSVQLDASEGDTPQQVCRGSATHHLQPYGAHPQIRSMKIQGQKACLVWPSEEQGTNSDAELVIAYPQPIEIEGSGYGLLILYADKNHILQISRTIRFLYSKGQGAGALPQR